MPAPAQKSNYDHDWEYLRLGQFQRLLNIREFGRETEDITDIDPTTLARDLERIEDKLKSGKLTEKTNLGRSLSPIGEMIASAFEPVLTLCDRLASGELPGSPYQKCFRIGSGGSLASWLVGSRINSIREAVSAKPLLGGTSTEAQKPKIEVETLKNQVTALRVSSGSLDCGLVRAGVFEDTRLKLQSEKIGIIDYCLYVPTKTFAKELEGRERNVFLPFEIEKKILETGPVATVGPDGQFRVKLNDALESGRRIDANIELSYRAFPMLLAHMMLASHVTIMPDIELLGGQAPPNYSKFKANVLKDYKRDIFLIVHQEYRDRMPSLDYAQLYKALSFFRDAK
jgi:hypothetical protein